MVKSMVIWKNVVNVKKKNISEEETKKVLRLQKENPNPGKEMMVQPPMSDENMGGDPQNQMLPTDNDPLSTDINNVENSEMQELIDLLNANPDRIEGITNYAKGIIGNDTVPGGEEQIQQPGGMQEGKNYNLDEIVDEILTGKDRNLKPSITRPQSQTNAKDKLFKPKF